jgi:hypothetical protein
LKKIDSHSSGYLLVKSLLGEVVIFSAQSLFFSDQKTLSACHRRCLILKRWPLVKLRKDENDLNGEEDVKSVSAIFDQKMK